MRVILRFYPHRRDSRLTDCESSCQSSAAMKAKDGVPWNCSKTGKKFRECDIGARRVCRLCVDGRGSWRGVL